MKLLMISGDRSLAVRKRGAFYYMLSEFRQYWDRVDVLCPQVRCQMSPACRRGRDVRCQIFDNVFVHPADTGRLGQPWFILRKGQELFREHKHDLMTVHEYPPFYNGIGARMLYNKIKIPYVLEFHHIVGHPRAADLKEKFYRFLYKIFAKWDCGKAGVVRVVNAKQTGEFLADLGVEKEKIKNIGSQYIDFDIFKLMDVEKKYDIVFAGRLVKNKNVGMLIEAVKIVRGEMLDVRCVIVGDGPEKENLQSEIKNQQLEDNIEFAGWLPKIEDVAGIYNQSKIFVMPSLNEGGPRVCLEAMACGVPVVTTRVGVMIDIIREKGEEGGQGGEGKKAGLFCDWTAEGLADKILWMLEDDERRVEMGVEARKTVERFERKNMIRQLAKTYQEIALH